MKKVFGNILLFEILLVLIIFTTSLVTAQESNFERAARSIASITSDGLDIFGLGPNTLTILLLGLLLWMILYSVVIKVGLFEDKPLMSGIIALISTILAFIFLRNQPTFLRLVEGQFGALGATILVVFPFLLAFYFTATVTESLYVAKAIWAVFGIYYLITFIFVWGESTSPFFSKDTFWYLGAAIASLILFIFIPLIRKGFWDVEIAAIKERARRRVKKAGVGVRAAEKLAEEFGEGTGI